MKTRLGIGLALGTSALSLSCAFSLHRSGGFSSSSDHGTPSSAGGSAPSEASSEASSGGSSKRGGGDDSPGAPAPVISKPPVLGDSRPPAPADWNGTYAKPDSQMCDDTPKFDPTGPDVQSFRTQHWDFQTGFKCPGTCTNGSKVTLAKGKASFPLVWVEPNPPYDHDGFQTVTMHRYRFELAVGTADSATIGGKASYETAPFKWTSNGQSRLSDGFSVEVGLLKRADVHRGTGRQGLFYVAMHDPAPHSPEFEWSTNVEAGCEQVIYRSDWKPGDGIDPDDDGGGGGGDSASSSSSSSSSERSACKSQCKSQAGSCRSGCRGQSASCASSCNHDESSCERACG
jgi:hypothetical protein